VRALCERFGDDYWSEHDQTATFPSEFHKAVAEASPCRRNTAGRGSASPRPRS
jgi:hypothetical protein